MVSATIGKGLVARFTFGRMTLKTFSPNSMSLNTMTIVTPVVGQASKQICGKEVGYGNTEEAPPYSG